MPEPGDVPQEFRVGRLDDPETEDEGAPVARSVELGPEVAVILGLPETHAPLTAETRTARFRDRTIDDGVKIFARITKRTVTVTRMVAPATGLPFLLLSYAYTVSSTGWRTGGGSPEMGGAPHRIDFKNEDGGVMWTWRMLDPLEVACGWENYSDYRWHAERTVIDWFDLWARNPYHVEGTFYRCF